MLKKNLTPLVFALFAAICLSSCPSAFAQIKVVEAVQNGSANRPETFEIAVTPAGQPTPIFTNRLTVLPHETTSGNAATAYMHSLGENILRGQWARARVIDGQIENWWNFRATDGPPQQDKIASASKLFDSYIQNHIAPATLKRECDWGYGLEDMEGPRIITTPLNGLQTTRSISRAIGLQTRTAILDSKFGDAVDLMRMNYRLGENVGKSGTLVGTLIGLSEVGIVNSNMLEFIATPGSPNMYWALTELPRPIVDLRRAHRLESRFAMRIFPALADAETADHTPEEWSRIVQKFPEVVMSAYEGQLGGEEKWMPTLLGVLAYAPAKQRLIDAGMSPEKVEAMAVGQVLLIDANREYRRLADLLEKEMYLPAPEFLSRMKAVENSVFGNRFPIKTLRSFGGYLARVLLPSSQVRIAQIRAQRDIDAMRVIEALRMHLAVTGDLPKSLDEIKVVPVPSNPATGKPFQYRIDGQTAVIDLLGNRGLQAKRFVIKAK